MHNDLTFFTNEPGRTLLNRFTISLENNTQFFDVLVGYFRTSGFYKLYASLEDVDKIRILVGISTDNKVIELIDSARIEQIELQFSSKEIKDQFQSLINNEYDSSDDSYEVEQGARKFVEFIRNGKLEVRAYPHGKIHAKVYIIRKRSQEDFGKVITGSSNFTEAGLKDNLEFNVELKDARDVRYALEKFEELWDESIEITREYVDTVSNTWVRDDITPYELYLKFLYEYFKEEINHDKSMIKNRYLPPGFKKLQYQEEAVIDAKKKLEAYGGVFLADVVGLGKTYISAMLAQQLEGRKLVVCPPVLVDYWDDTFKDFNQVATVVSMGKLDQIIEKDYTRYDYIFIDEAHRFRNENTQSYEMIHRICAGKKLILISATPLNNYPKDIASQLYLFQKRNDSSLAVKHLDSFFAKINTRLRKHDKGTNAYNKELKAASKELRERVLQDVMVRRTRRDIIENYAEDLEAQNITFPELEIPCKLVYEMDTRTERLFNNILTGIKSLTYARYKSLVYLKNPSNIQATLMVGQMNMGGFMKSILIKRLESSFYAFSKTLDRFVTSHEHFIRMYEEGTIWISKNPNIYDYIDSGDDEALLDLLEQEKAHKFNSKEFKDEFITDLISDYNILCDLQKQAAKIIQDPKIEKFQLELSKDPVLKDNKIIIFTEAADTAEYLSKKLKAIYGDKVLHYSSSSSKALKKRIQANFDPGEKKQKDDIKILITTDVLAEGVNLHRSNVIINYDLPWNPTRVMQRLGRINRIGSPFDKIYVYNFFPSSQGESAINLEANIVSKIQAFHETLGDDIKYLSDNEEITSYGLYQALNDKAVLEGSEEEIRSPLHYLSIIRKVRDEDPDLFEKIKKLPKKSRTGRNTTLVDGTQTLSFFKKGLLRKFYISGDSGPEEMSFFQAADLFEADPQVISQKINRKFYEQLNQNKKSFFHGMVQEEEEKPELSGKSASLVKYLKALYSEKCFADFEVEYLRSIETAVREGVVAKSLVNQLLKKINGKKPIEILNILQEDLPDVYLQVQPDDKKDNVRAEIILSEYLIGG